MLSDGIKSVSSLLVNDPWKLKLDAPFPVWPSVTIYLTVITEAFSNLRPNNPSPNNISYF